MDPHSYRLTGHAPLIAVDGLAKLTVASMGNDSSEDGLEWTSTRVQTHWESQVCSRFASLQGSVCCYFHYCCSSFPT